MGMMTNDQIYTLLEPPSRLFSLRLARPLPVDGDCNQIGSLLGDAEFVQDLGRKGDVEHAPGRRNPGEGDEYLRACAEWDKLR
jgi:hypothetical protein